MIKIIILLDYKGYFQCSAIDIKNYSSMDVTKVVTYLETYGYSVNVISFGEIDFRMSYEGQYVLYHSAEDRGLFYKSYIEDICFFLHNSGAILLPGLIYLRAHHNKSLMEMMRYQFKSSKLKTIKSSIFGTHGDSKKNNFEFPVVLKSAEGTGSTGVKLIHNKKEFELASKHSSRVLFANSYVELIKKIVLSIVKPKGKREYTDFRNKFIVQNFIDGLSGDFKVLFYGGKYYILGRKNRENDFRASGSGLFFEVSKIEEEGILSFSKLIVDELNEPIIGMDIGFDGINYHLIEFQIGVFLSPYPLERSEYWYEFTEDNNSWNKILGKSEVEQEYCRSMHLKINNIINQKKDYVY
jgi:hypothetical protein